jgi:hypothetical protein
MSAQPAHDTFEEPFWQVQGVFDPDGQEPDFSYTIGLHDRGLPELHLWAQPDEGEDPGADWVLSTSDRGHLLNELARLAVRGRLGVGAELERRYDAGRTTLRFRVGPPADREVLEAYGIAPDASVLPVHWSLHRAPEGPRGAMTPEQEQAAASAYDEVTAGLVEGRRAPTGWTLPRTPSFAPEQRFGPRTPVVLARAAQLWQADDETVADLLYAALLVESAGMSLTNPVAVAGALAREVGRSRCLADLHDDVEGLVSWLTTRPAARARWRRVVRTFDPRGGRPWRPTDATAWRVRVRGCCATCWACACPSRWSRTSRTTTCCAPRAGRGSVVCVVVRQCPVPRGPRVPTCSLSSPISWPRSTSSHSAASPASTRSR